jgi:hypothetical protein
VETNWLEQLEGEGIPLRPLSQHPRSQPISPPDFAPKRPQSNRRKAAQSKGVPFRLSRSTVAGVMGIGLLGAFVLFCTWYARQVVSLTNRAARVGDARRSRDLTKLADLRTKPGNPSPTPATAASARRMTIAPATMQVGELAVGVASVRLGPIQVDDQRQIPGDHVSFKLRVTNLSRSPFHYRSWSQQTTGVILNDSLKNYYNRVLIEDPPVTEGWIQPGQTISDLIAFEPPLKQFGYWELHLPSPEHIPYAFRIPSHLAERATAPTAPAGVAAAPAGEAVPRQAPAPAPIRPENDPQTRSRVLADYRNGAASIERRARGMGFDRGRKFRLEGAEKLIEEIAERYELSSTQVRAILGK